MVDYQRDDSRCRITIITTGKVTTDEVIAVLDRQAHEGTWSYAVLYEARGGENVPRPDDLRRLLLHVGTLTARYGPRGPVALVTSVPRLTRMGRLYSTLGELTALDMEVFSDVAHAEAWLTEREGRPLGH